MEITAGRYDVRLYVKYKGGYSYYDTKTVELAKDGWKLGLGCREGMNKPALLFK